MESDRTERLDRELRDLGQIADTTPLGIFRMTAERRLTYVNRRFADMFGLDVGDFLPRVPEEFGRRRVEAELLEQYVPADEDAPTADLGGVEFNIVAPETSQVINVRLFAAFDATGAPTPLGYCQDVTEQYSRSETLLVEARTDPLSGLANRKAMDEFCLLHPNQPIAVLLCDVDGFKQVNDTIGHAAGDAVIAAFAERLRDAVRPSDLVARIGGDEFVIIAPGVNTYDDAVRIADRVHPLFRLPIDHEGHMIELSATIGVALGQPGEEVTELLKKSDHALYEAKHSGRDRVTVHRDDRVAETLTPIVLRRELRHALEDDKLHVEFQPIVRLDGGLTKSLKGEALLRWDHPTFGRIPPSRIIPVAEQTGMIRQLGRFTATSVVRAAASLSAQIDKPVMVGMNLSATQIADPKFLPALVDALDEYGISARHLPIELTESHRVHDVDGALAALHQLVDMGARIAIDDFGSGVSTYEYMLTLPVHVVKIDKVFTDHVTNRRGFEMLRSFAQACRNLDISVVAEGVETFEQLDAILAAGIELGQGFLLSPPVPEEQFLDAIARTHQVVIQRPAAA